MAQQEFVNQYSRAERLLHRMAFASSGLQVTLADIEDRLHRSLLVDVEINRPVLITALPRAGTTLLLNLLHRTGEFAGHTYRHMPFVLCPMLWQRLASAFRTGATTMERAHGDGVEVSVNSAEAFEEMVWRPFWPKHYRTDRISPWTETPNVAFNQFLRSHWRKLIALEGGDPALRYLSKNNLNIARLDYLTRQFPDAVMVVPFRDPVQHAASLLNQHRRFCATHEHDAFARDYMRGVGHYDFGHNLRPVDFDGWLENRSASATELTFWLEYWVAAYRHVLARIGKRVQLLPFEALMQRPRAGLQWLAGYAGVRDRHSLFRQSQTLRTPSAHAVDTANVPQTLLDSARSVHADLTQHSSVRAWSGDA